MNTEQLISTAGWSKLDFGETDKCQPVLLRLSLAGNLESQSQSLEKSLWRDITGFVQVPRRTVIESLEFFLSVETNEHFPIKYLHYASVQFTNKDFPAPDIFSYFSERKL
jgi:hypothetical protein